MAYGNMAPIVPAASPWDAPDVRAFDRQFADMQQQLDRQMDSMFSFGDVRRFEQKVDRQMDSIEQQIDRQMDLIDQQMDRAFQEMNQFSREMDLEMARSMRKLAEQQPEVKIERQEQRSPGMYRFQLVLLWPFLAIASPEFRRQLVSALKGEKVTVTRGQDDQQQQQL